MPDPRLHPSTGAAGANAPGLADRHHPGRRRIVGALAGALLPLLGGRPGPAEAAGGDPAAADAAPADAVPGGPKADAARAPDAQALLRASDAIRNPVRSFSLTSTLIEYRGGRQVDGNTLAIYSRPDEASGQYSTLIRFLAPARDQGKLMLKNGNELWFYDPANQAGIRISPEQRLLGQAANGDVATVNLARDYRAAWVGAEEINDGDRRPRRCHHLALEAADPGVTYRRIALWLDATDARPIRARFYADGERLLKTAFYRRTQRELGVDRPTETVIIDGLDPGWVTVMRFADYAWRDVPEAWLQRDYLPRFRPE